MINWNIFIKPYAFLSAMLDSVVRYFDIQIFITRYLQNNKNTLSNLGYSIFKIHKEEGTVD